MEIPKMIIALCLAGAGSVAADTAWRPMDGAEIKTALTDKKLQYAGAWQDFGASGRTVYHAGADSWGYWRVQGNQYCSKWPPQDRWACYDMARSGDKLRFMDASGEVTEADYYRE